APGRARHGVAHQSRPNLPVSAQTFVARPLRREPAGRLAAPSHAPQESSARAALRGSSHTRARVARGRAGQTAPRAAAMGVDLTPDATARPPATASDMLLWLGAVVVAVVGVAWLLLAQPWADDDSRAAV